MYLSQVDVNSILQELWGLPGPLLNGQHTDCFHTGLQLDHTCILILRDIRGGEGRRLSVNEKLIVTEGCLDLYTPPHNQKECFFITIWPHSSVTAHRGWQTSVIPCCIPITAPLLLQLKTTAAAAEASLRAQVCVFFILPFLNFHFHCLLIKIQLISEWLCVEI